ncbi:Transcriptional adapter 2-alpha [Ilyodon furcidens]|uniref:Transcriptional adapter 2-alpha n=1 Tax=Ilyodon furcidens TaxID=33524 RepID=A0ABV0TN77_9TELE
MVITYGGHRIWCNVGLLRTPQCPHRLIGTRLALTRALRNRSFLNLHSGFYLSSKLHKMDCLASFANDPFDKPPCRGCSSYLTEPYIKCAECGPAPFLLCLQCFTRGFEYKKHESDHKYEIMTSDFPVLEPGWTAQEEMALLEAVMDCGFGNWQDVAYQMRTKTKEECESHYMKNFINNPLFSSTLLSLRKTKDSRFADGAIPFKSSDDPPRPTFESVLSRDMAGYMPARADFMEEFDNYAEWDLKDIDFVDDDSDILHTLKLAVVDIYHSRLKERQRRKKIIRDHGLINLRKFQSEFPLEARMSSAEAFTKAWTDIS